MRRLAALTTLLVALASAHPAGAQALQASPMQTPGARAGNAYVPSTHTPGCGGILCDSDDPRRVAGTPPPPCEGLLCGLSPYAMAPPVTAAEAARIQEERARAAAAAAAAPAPIAPTKHARRHVAKAKARRTVAARTPDPSAAPATDAATTR